MKYIYISAWATYLIIDAVKVIADVPVIQNNKYKYE